MKKFILFTVIVINGNLYSQEEGLIVNGNTNLHYRTFGKGKPLLIINGGPGMNSEGFADLALQLSQYCQTIIYDQRGTGKSPVDAPDSSNITMKLMAEDIETLRKHLKINRFIILGHSFGGMLASYYATLYPARIEGIILSSSGGIDLGLLDYVQESINSKLNHDERDSLGYWTKKISEGDTGYYAKSQKANILARVYVYNRQHIPVVAKRLTQTNAQVNSLVWQNLQRIHFNCKKQLSSFSKPVLILQGKQDNRGKKTAMKSHEAFKNSELVLMDSCAHYGWLDRPDEYFGKIKKFISLN